MRPRSSYTGALVHEANMAGLHKPPMVAPKPIAPDNRPSMEMILDRHSAAVEAGDDEAMAIWLDIYEARLAAEALEAEIARINAEEAQFHA